MSQLYCLGVFIRYFNPPPTRSGVHFTVASAEELTRQGHLKVVAKHLYEQDGKRTPVAHGVLDRRMGTCSKDFKCATCSKGLVDCVGHFGYVDLELPVFHCGYFVPILNILQTICKVIFRVHSLAVFSKIYFIDCGRRILQDCGAILLKPEDKEDLRDKVMRPNMPYLLKKALRRKILVLAKKMHVCIYCGSPNGIVKKCAMLRIAHDKFRYSKNSPKLKAFEGTKRLFTSQV